MLVYEFDYSAVHESLRLFIEDKVVNDDIDFIKSVLYDNINKRITINTELLSSPIIYMHSARCRYYTEIINEYKRLLFAIEYSYTINDLRDIHCLSVISHKIYLSKAC